MGCTLPCATAAVLGGVKVGRGLTVSADGTLEMTAETLTRCWALAWQKN